MAKCTFENLTPEQAKEMARWYEAQGEQDADVWFDINGVEAPMTDCRRKGGFMEIDTDGNVTVFCK